MSSIFLHEVNNILNYFLACKSHMELPMVT